MQPTSLPTPSSELFGAFVWQQDSKYGYAMLRPAGWMATDSGVARVYNPNPQPREGRLAISAVRYSGALVETNGEDVHWQLFRENLLLGAWAEAVNQKLWKDSDVRLERELDSARIYSVRPTAGYIRYTGYVVDQGQPMIVTLEAGGGLSVATRLEELGILDDFAVVVGSARAAK